MGQDGDDQGDEQAQLSLVFELGSDEYDAL
jgi:hypothetical protein